MWRRQVVEQQLSECVSAVDERPIRFARGTQEVERIPDEKIAGAQSDAQAHRIEAQVAEIVHDLKSPLAAIALETALLDDKLARADRIGGLRSIDRINHNVAFLDRLVLDLLDVCSLASGNLQLHREPTEMRKLLERVIERSVAAPHRMRVRIDAARAVMMMVDAHRIERVVANLVDNAIKYTPPTSGIVVRLAGFRGGACVSVIDEGPGLDPDECATIFDRYQRGSTSRGRSGCGLGLFVSKKIIEAHGGQIAVESIRGIGSRFFFELPAV